MTVSSQTTRTSYAGAGSTGPYTIGFTILDDDHLNVTKTVDATGVQTELTKDAGSSGYTVNAALTQITLTEALAAGETLVILRNVPKTQEIDYLANDPFPSETNEEGLDKLTQITQQIDEELSRAILAPIAASLTTNEISGVINSTNKLVALSTAGPSVQDVEAADLATLAGISADIETLADIEADIATLADIEDGTDATDAIQTVAGISSNVTTVAGISANVTTVAGISANVTTVAGNDANITTVASNIANVQAAAEALSAAIAFTFDSATTMADPGTGDVRFNNASFASVTSIAIDALTAQTGNPDLSDFIATFDDSTSTNKGYLRFSKGSAPENFVIFQVTAVTDNTGWLQLTVSHVDSAGSFSNTDTLYMVFTQTGDQGNITTVTNIDAATSAGANLRNVGGTTCASWGGGGGQNFSITNTLSFGAGGASVDIVRDEDDMSSNDANALATQQSIKAYVDAAGGGAWEFISSQTAASDSSLDFTSFINNTDFDNYVFVLTDIFPGTDGTEIALLLSTDGLSTTIGSPNYIYSRIQGASSAATVNGNNSTGGSDLALGSSVGNDTGEGLSAIVYLFKPSSTTHKKIVADVIDHDTSGAVKQFRIACKVITTSAVNAVRFQPDTGNFSGTIALYGIKKA